MNDLLVMTGYVKKMEELLKEISPIACSSGEIQKELLSSYENLQSAAGGKILLLFLDVSSQFLSRLLPILLSKDNPDGMARFNQDRAIKINNYIQANLDKELKEKDVADFIGMSVGRFSRFFRDMNSCRFSSYRTRCKINLATKLLKDTDAQIIDICYQCGFGTQSQFNRVFKKAMKMSPSEYRLAGGNS